MSDEEEEEAEEAAADILELRDKEEAAIWLSLIGLCISATGWGTPILHADAFICAYRNRTKGIGDPYREEHKG